MNPRNLILNTLPLILAANLASASIPLAPRMGAGGKMDMFGCMLSNDFYIANFAAYQTDPQQPKNAKVMLAPLCQEIPKTGETQITVDMLDRDVRQKPVTLKVFNSDKQLVAETPTKVAKQGYISTTVNFPKPGHYDLVAYVNDQDLKIAPEKSALHIPLTVAIVVPGPSASMGNVMMVILGVGALAFGLGVLVPRWMKPQATA
ncbi:MAG: hypothetical protein HOP02_05485 [Methylococcaceae bacterium]|nr:hypothetical protein [Methylococcaceae bacterium]